MIISSRPSRIEGLPSAPSQSIGSVAVELDTGIGHGPGLETVLWGEPREQHRALTQPLCCETCLTVSPRASPSARRDSPRRQGRPQAHLPSAKNRYTCNSASWMSTQSRLSIILLSGRTQESNPTQRVGCLHFMWNTYSTYYFIGYSPL